MGHLDEVDLSLSLGGKEEERELGLGWRRLAQLRLTLGGLIGAKELGPPLVVVFEGWDASGKGGAIERLGLAAGPAPRPRRPVRGAEPGREAPPLPAPILARLPGWGGMAVDDRSWYGRVLVERVGGLAGEKQWRRACEEIVGFEQGLAEEGAIVAKRGQYEEAVEEMLDRTDRRRARWRQEPPPAEP
jgi:polyphosphate kinase 2 (PPK2 family)